MGDLLTIVCHLLTGMILQVVSYPFPIVKTSAEAPPPKDGPALEDTKVAPPEEPAESKVGEQQTHTHTQLGALNGRFQK